MKAFKEMVTLVKRRRAKKVRIIDDSLLREPDNLIQRLYNGIADGTFATDKDASKILYESEPGDKKYLMLKSRLKERLLNTLFFLDQKKIHESDYQRAVYQCNRDYFCTRILLAQGARTSGIELVRSTLITARKFDLNEIAFLCAKTLRHHASMSGLKRDYHEYDMIAKESLVRVKAENRADTMYESLLYRYARSKAFRPEMAAIAKEYFNQSNELSKYTHSFHLKIVHYRIGLLYYQIIRNYESLLNLCHHLQKFLRNHPRFKLASREGEIALLKMVCCLYLSDYKAGKTNAEEALKFYAVGSNNWFVVMENYFLLAMHGEKYEQASELYEQATTHPRFQYLSPEKAEQWKIFEAYLNYVLPNQQKEFKIMKFLNEVPIYSRDKEGFYAAILIAQVLYLIDRNDEDKLEVTIESLRMFSSRHLTMKKAPRTAYFIKMLRQLVNNSYRVNRVKSRTMLYYNKLKETGMIGFGEVDTMEIIPYENIWSIILSRIESRRVRRPLVA